MNINSPAFPLEVLSIILVKSENPAASRVCKRFFMAFSHETFYAELIQRLKASLPVIGLSENGATRLSSSLAKHQTKELKQLIAAIFDAQQEELAKFPGGVSAFRSEPPSLSFSRYIRIDRQIDDLNLQSLAKSAAHAAKVEAPSVEEAIHRGERMWKQLEPIHPKIKKIMPDGVVLTRIPREIEQLTKLRELIVIDNHLKAIPAHIERLSQLRKLVLNNVDVSAIPSALARLPKLDKLTIERCPVHEISPEVTESPNKAIKAFLKQHRKMNAIFP